METIHDDLAYGEKNDLIGEHDHSESQKQQQQHQPKQEPQRQALQQPSQHPFHRSDSTGHFPNRPNLGSSIIRKSVALKRFSALVSTEQHHATTKREFFGPYAHLRKGLDYTTYHTNYRKERQWLQDSIIEDMLDNADDKNLCITPTEPWLINTIGARGAGKHHVVRYLVEHDLLPLLTFVNVDPEEIRRRLPEYTAYATKCPFMVDVYTKKEVGYIAEILTLAALQAGRNVVIDGALESPEWRKQQFETLRTQYPNLKLAILHITAPRDVILQRCRVRFLSSRKHRCRGFFLCGYGN